MSDQPTPERGAYLSGCYLCGRPTVGSTVNDAPACERCMSALWSGRYWVPLPSISYTLLRLGLATTEPMT